MLQHRMNDLLAGMAGSSQEKAKQLREFFGAFPSPEELAATAQERHTRDQLAVLCARQLADQLHQLQELRPAPVSDAFRTATLPTGYTGQELLSCPDLARLAMVNEAALFKRLERFRAESDRGYVTVTNRGPRLPQYLYYVREVWSIVSALKEQEQDLSTSFKRQPKKKA
jgi:hypothetical protein